MNDYEWNRNQGAAAAAGLLAATLGPHGRHAGPSAHSAPHDAAGPGSIVIPARAVPSAERTGNVVEVKQAENVRRRGTVQAAEGLAQRDGHGVEQMFAGGFSDARAQRPGGQFYEVKLSDGRSGLADGHDSGNPAWSTDAAQNMGVLMGILENAQGTPGKIPLLRPGSTPYNHTRLDQLDLSERGRTSYGYVMGNDLKQPRHNEAEVN